MRSRDFLCDAAIAAGHELGVFDALARGPASLDELGDAIGVVAGRRRLGALLDVLAAIGALAALDVVGARAVGGAAGANPAPSPRRFAVAAVPPRPEIPRAGWGLAAEVIRSNVPLPIEHGGEADRRLHEHLAGAGARAARELAGELYGTLSLLDLGSGAGAYSQAFLATRPTATATLVDRAEVLALAAERLGPLASRARFVAGDASTVALGEGHHAVLLANLLHLQSPAMCARLCAVAAAAVAPSGTVVIKDLRVDDDRTGPLEGLLFALNMALYTEAGDVYSTTQLRAWLAEAGLVDITERGLAASPDVIVLFARRPVDDAGRQWQDPDEQTSDVDTDATAGPTTRDAEPPMAAAGPVDRGAPSLAALASLACDRKPRLCRGAQRRVAARRVGRVDRAPGGDAVEAVAAELDAALARTAEDAWRARAASGSIRADAAAAPPALALPRGLRSFLAAALAIERSDASRGDAAAAGRAEQLVRHYTDAMPRMRIAQLAGTSEPGQTLFHARLDWQRLPRLRAAIDRLFALAAEAGVDATSALGAASAAAFYARTPTLAKLYERTHYGGFMPLLYGYPADLAYFHARGVAEQRDALATIDHYLSAPIVHELCHGPRGRRVALPPHLDECMAGWLGVYVHPELAYPSGANDDALYAAPWLAQVGQAIARAFGVASVVRAQLAGDAAALPAPFMQAAARLGWVDWRTRRTLHFLSDTFDPQPWLALALGRDAGAPTPASPLADDPAFDRAIVEDGLRAMCLVSAQIDGSLRTRAELPDGPIIIDPAVRAIIAPGRRGLDPVVPRYWLPPAVAASLATRQPSGYLLALHSLAAIPAAAAALCEPGETSICGDGFSATPR